MCKLDRHLTNATQNSSDFIPFVSASACFKHRQTPTKLYIIL